MEKIVFIILVFFLALQSCKEEDTSICGVDDPATELPWLSEIIVMAEIDTTGNYQGTIYLEHYNNIPVFFTNMAMGSGGVIGYWFNCDGSTFTIDDQGKFLSFSNSMKLNKIIYTNN